jgi:hypothetical protein
MGFQAVKIGGVSPAYVKSFRWVKPGIAEAVVVQEARGPDEGDPPMPALPLQGLRLESVQEDIEDGIGTKTWVYRAGQTLPASPTDTNANPDEVWTCDVSLSERPLTSNPAIDRIMAKYGGVLKAGVVEFPPKMSDGGVNPLYMVETYFVPSVTVTMEKSAPGAISTTAVSGVGFLDNPAAGGSAFGFCNSDLKWLLVEHSVSRQGGDGVVRKSWRYDPRGWLKQIYKRGYWG